MSGFSMGFTGGFGPSPRDQTFDTPGEHSWIVPENVTSVHVLLKAGPGGSPNGLRSSSIEADIIVTPGETLSIFVGDTGVDNSGATGGAGGITGDASTEGKAGGNRTGLTGAGGGGGGGATDVRQGGSAKSNVILLAAGRGGEAGNGNNSQGAPTTPDTESDAPNDATVGGNNNLAGGGGGGGGWRGGAGGPNGDNPGSTGTSMAHTEATMNVVHDPFGGPNYGSTPINGSAVLTWTPAPAPDQKGSASPIANASIAIDYTVGTFAVSSISASGTSQSTATVESYGAASLESDSTIAVTSSVVVNGVINLTSIAETAVDYVVTHFAVGALNGAGSLSAGGIGLSGGSATIESTASTLTLAFSEKFDSSNQFAEALLEANGFAYTSGTASMSAVSTTDIQSYLVQSASASLAANATQTSDSHSEQYGGSVQDSAATLAAPGTVISFGQSNQESIATLTADYKAGVSGSASVVGTGDVSADPSVDVFASTSQLGTATVTADSVGTGFGSLSISSAAFTTADAVRRTFFVSSLDGVASVEVSAFGTLGPPTLVDPVNGATIDASNGYTFDWTHDSDEAQVAYRFKRRVTV